MRIWLALLAISAAAILLVVLLAEPEEGPDAEAGRGEEPRTEQEAAAQSEEARAFREPVLQKIEAERERTVVEGATVGSSTDEVDWASERVETADKKQEALLAAAASAGRTRSPEESEALRELEAELESEIGREDYDRTLYEAGETNRVRVRVPMERSPGAAAGLEPGDVVLEYNGHPIYRKEDLHAFARSAPPNTDVPIAVRRGGSYLQTKTRSGPLGTFFEEFREEPQ